MPIGVIVNALSIFLGGVIGSLIGKYLKKSFVDNMNMVFGCCSFAMGISNIVLMEDMPAVILAVIVGTVIGLLIHLGDLVNKAGAIMEKGISKFIKGPKDVSREEFEATLVTCIALFCASGTGIYGSMIAGISGDNSILFAKSVLDLFTAVVFACSLGAVTSVVAIPQFVVFLILFLVGGPIYHYLDLGTNTYILNDFKACGGLLVFATGFRMMKVKMVPVADMIPAMVLIFPASIFWHEVIAPFVAQLASMM